ncbi:DUF1672 family protein [Bacillus sp. FJAT-47783]|uniref:DUF1672 family protein n=1 Tax=Bacillus sp. FJAT-47783 TaxID=2922712 RepID=UPI001FABE0D3|nr:DUF1672 family protein [Bacillus sp. FJAT-47783]
MKHKKKMILLSIGMSVLLGGCVNMNSSKENQKDETLEEKHTEESNYISVQDYTGEEYTLQGGEKTDKIAEANRNEIDKAVKKFFLDNYKTEVKVHNIVGAADGATVFVESIGEPHFYTFAVVPIDVHEEKVYLNKVFSQEGQVEDAIKGGLYAMIFEDEFEKLNQYLNDLSNKGDVIGRTVKSLENVGGTGYMTPYYYITTSIHDKAIVPVFDMYLKNSNTSMEELLKVFDQNQFLPKNFNITIQLFMKERNAAPSEELFKQICEDIKKMDGIPKGSYSVIINDNNIDKLTNNGVKDNSLKKTYPNYIVKE